jgi:DnaJ-class molecular chaperone
VVLSDPWKKEVYDYDHFGGADGSDDDDAGGNGGAAARAAGGNARGGGPGPSSNSKPSQKQQKRAASIVYNLPVTLEDMCKGFTKKMKITRYNLVKLILIELLNNNH